MMLIVEQRSWAENGSFFSQAYYKPTQNKRVKYCNMYILLLNFTWTFFNTFIFDLSKQIFSKGKLAALLCIQTGKIIVVATPPPSLKRILNTLVTIYSYMQSSFASI